MTTRQTVTGVERMSPSGPHNQVQKAIATSSATCDTPAAPAYRTVSRTRFVNSSSATKNPATSIGPFHPGSAASAIRIGPAAAATGPTYGMKRSAAPAAPQNKGYGTPNAYKPPITSAP